MSADSIAAAGSHVIGTADSSRASAAGGAAAGSSAGQLLRPSPGGDPVGGGHSTATRSAAPTRELLAFTLDDLELGRVIGTGTFARVYLARHKASGTYYALKELDKRYLLRTKQAHNAVQEVELQREADHPFLVGLVGVHQDEERVHLLLELCQGGDLCGALVRPLLPLATGGRFSEPAARFYAAELVLALEYLHARHIAHRDVKLSDLLMTSSGHIKLGDLGFAKVIWDRSYTLCGTGEVFCPDLVLGKGHTLAVDWWYMGVVVFEMLVGYHPYASEDQMEATRAVLMGRPAWPADVPVSAQAKDLVEKLLLHGGKRLGSAPQGAAGVKAHPWFADIDWRALEARALAPPYVPELAGPADTSLFDEEGELPVGPTWVQEEAQVGARSLPDLTKAEQEPFRGLPGIFSPPAASG